MPDKNLNQILGLRSVVILMAITVIGTSFSCLSYPTFGAEKKHQMVQEDTTASDAKSGPSAKSDKKARCARSVTRFVVNASPERVWQTLVDFPKYPQIFSRIKSCQVTKQEGSLIWIESNLRPHMFIKEETNHTLNDLKKGPYVLEWQLLDGNFDAVKGKWELGAGETGNRCTVIYTLDVDPGPVVPAFLVSFMLKFVQKEIVTELKAWIESTSSLRASQSACVTDDRG